MITWESKICTSKCDGTHPFFGSVLFCISVMRPSFLQVLGLHHLKPIPKCTNGPLYKEDTHSCWRHVLERVNFRVVCAFGWPSFRFYLSKCWIHSQGLKRSMLCPGCSVSECTESCSSVGRDAANRGFRALWGPGDQWTAQIFEAQWSSAMADCR